MQMIRAVTEEEKRFLDEARHMADVNELPGFHEPQGEFLAQHDSARRSAMEQEVRKAYHMLLKLRGLAQKAPLHLINLVCHNFTFNDRPPTERLDLAKAVNESLRCLDDPDPDNPEFVEDLEELKKKHLQSRQWSRLVYVLEPLDDHSYYRLASELFCGGDLRDNTKPFPLFKLMQGGARHHALPPGTIAATVAMFLAAATEELFPVSMKAHMLLFDPRRRGQQERTHIYSGMVVENCSQLYWMLDVPRALRYDVDTLVRSLLLSRFKFSQMHDATTVSFSGYVFELPSSLSA